MSSNGDDMLSRLPEGITSHILSLMPMKFAKRTSILSKQWRYNWTLITNNLDFDDTFINPSHGHRFIDFVDQVLKHCKTPQVKLFRLNLSKFWVDKSSVSSWIDKAISLNVCELDIKVIQLGLPLSFFTCKTLTKLRLQSGSDWECSSSTNLPCLKNLDIVACKNPFANAFILICGCPVLESLSFEVIRDNQEEDYIFNIPTLKQLRLSFRRAVKKVINKVILNVPNLEYLHFGGKLGSLFVMEDVSSLVEALVSSDRRYTYTGYEHPLVELLKGVSRVKTLSTRNIPSALHLPVFPNMERLELKNVWQYGLISQFLESCPKLKHLCIKKEVGLFLEPGESSWIEPILVPRCMLTNLTTIKFSNCNKKRCDIEFLEYMLGNAVVLKRVTILSVNLWIEEDMRLCARLLKVPRASRNCEICISSSSGR